MTDLLRMLMGVGRRDFLVNRRAPETRSPSSPPALSARILTLLYYVRSGLRPCLSSRQRS